MDISKRNALIVNTGCRQFSQQRTAMEIGQDSFECEMDISKRDALIVNPGCRQLIQQRTAMEIGQDRCECEMDISKRDAFIVNTSCRQYEHNGLPRRLDKTATSVKWTLANVTLFS